MASEWVTAIIETPYLVVPLVAWLWDKARLPRMKWGRISAGALLTFGGRIVNSLILAMSPSLGSEWLLIPSAVLSVVSNAATIVGLAAMGFYVLKEGLAMLRAGG